MNRLESRMACASVWLCLAASSVLAAPPPGVSPDGIWQALDRAPAAKMAQSAWIRPSAGRVVEIDVTAWTNAMRRIPLESQPLAMTLTESMTLPMPDGSFARFDVVEAPVMEAGLAAKFPEIKTYYGVGVDDPSATVRFDWTPQGFHAQILSPHGAVYIDPYSRGDRSIYSVYYKRDYRRDTGFVCDTPTRDSLGGASAVRESASALRSGPTLRTYRLACAATGEYTAYHGGTVLLGQAAIVTAINRVTGVYEMEVGIRLILVANNDLLVYTNSATDPYTNNNGSTMLGQNQSTVDSRIGSGNYDIGHVFSTGGGGIAGLGVVCLGSQKARGVTGLTAPIGDPFYIDYVAHEMGHQFDGNHTFNSETGSCGGGNRNASTAYEPGSGSTIMAYAGICGADNLQGNSDPYFHSISFDEIVAYITTGSGNCGAQSSTTNTAPTVDAGPNYSIPANTPFILTASGTDPDGDPLTYCWEERDLGAAATLAAGDNGSSPLFRSFNPVADTWRTFPKLSSILSGATSLGEKLPTTTRTMNFRVTARDNRAGGGGVNTDDMSVSVTAAAGPFVVTAPNSGVIWSGQQTIAWNVAGTTGAPVNAAKVDIHLSTDGGNTWPYPLAIGTPNDGSEIVVLPNVSTTTARIKVQGASNIFFDVSDTDFSVVPGLPVARIVIDSLSFTNEGCLAANGALDPNEVTTVLIALRNSGTMNATDVFAAVITTTNLSAFTGSQSYGTLNAGGGSITQSFQVMASGNCGGSVNLLVDVDHGTNDFTVLTNSVTLGALVSASYSKSNAAAIAVPASGTKGKASPYPSTISVTGIVGTVSKVTVSIYGMTHTYPGDFDILLVGPAGQSAMIMSDAVGGNSMTSINMTFDDDAANVIPESSAVSSGSYVPTNYGTDSNMASPAPSGPYGSSLSIYDGTNPNGVWSLYVRDEFNGDAGDFTNGWSISVETFTLGCCTQSVVLPPVLTVAPSNLAFGVVATGTTSQLSFTLGNVGGSALTGVVSIAGGGFSIVSPAAFTIPASSATNATIQFAPSSSGTFTGQVVVASNGGGRTNALSGQGAIPPAASFAANTLTGTSPHDVDFTDQSLGTITSRVWSFGDGYFTNTTATSLVHTYLTSGVYDVTLTVSGPLGASTNSAPALITVTEPPLLAVTPSSLSFGPIAVGSSAQLSFMVANIGGTELSANVSLPDLPFSLLTDSNISLPPTATTNIDLAFSPGFAGVFSGVVVFASNGGGSTNVLSGEGAEAASAAFTASPTNGTAPLIVTFSDTSTGMITDRFWDFGDGGFTNTTETNLVYTYQTSGVYDVTLIVSGPVGVSTSAYQALIMATNLPVADISIVLTDDPDVVESNAALRYDMVIHNAGPSFAPSLVVTAIPPPGVMFNAGLSSPECSESNGVIVCYDPGLTAGGLTSLYIRFDVDPGTFGQITGHVEVVADAVDSNTLDNSASEVTFVPDLDSDAIPDFADPDDDGDQIPDDFEMESGLNSKDPLDALADGDGDFVSSLDEYYAGTNPGDSNSYLHVVSMLQSNQALFSFPSSTSRLYYLEMNTNPPSQEWLVITTNAPGAGGVMSIVGTNVPDPDIIHYRIGVRLP